MAVNATSAQPSRDALRPTLPLVVVDRGEAGNLAAETLYCMSCSLPAAYRRRANRASGTDQPLSLHRFSHCGCGADTTILMHELFPSVYQITFMMFRPATTTSDRTLTLATLTASGDRRDLVAAASDQPQPSVRRFPVEDARCAGCSDRMALSHLLSTVRDVSSLFRCLSYRRNPSTAETHLSVTIIDVSAHCSKASCKAAAAQGCRSFSSQTALMACAGSSNDLRTKTQCEERCVPCPRNVACLPPSI
jgi:hypothetical protein